MSGARALLDRTLPFQFLPAARRAALEGRLERRRFLAGEAIVRRGERSRDVFLLERGEVEVVEDDQVLSTISPGHYFGERAAFFDIPRPRTLRAGGEVAVYALPSVDFLELLQIPAFAHSIATSLTVKQRIFQGYRHIWALILTLVEGGDFLLSDLTPAYRALHPALHPLLHSEQIDLGALAYAVARLPEDVSRTHFYFLSTDLPPLYRDPDSKFDPVRMQARRRSAWRALPGKTIVLLRDGISDITDLLTCLCAYAVEARKIRRRCRSSALLAALRRRQLGEGDEAELVRLCKLSPQEIAGLERIWPGALWDRIHEILLHHEDVSLECDFLIDNYNSSAAERWIRQIWQVAGGMVDLEDPALEIHLISSNTHSVGNCLSPFLARRRDQILAWGRANRPALCAQGWRDESDLLYALARAYETEVPGARDDRIREERAGGHHRLSTTAYTGIAVDLICARSLDPELVDPVLRFEKPEAPTLLVNIDYAFGQQAEEILANLLFVFGTRVRSVSVLGKAGGLEGGRGDLLLPRATLLQTNDELYPLPNADLDADRLRRLAGDRAVYEGPVLTVAGTLLQDRWLLYFYRRIWRCVGLEMEGSYFARKLISAIETGVARPDVRSRFAYYISDVPLDVENNLSESLSPAEGVPPLYAITRAILQQILAP